jgi:hypothetical protein
MENYPPKFLSMRTIFQRGNIQEDQINELNQNAINTIASTKEDRRNSSNSFANDSSQNMNQFMTPNTKKLYAFGESSSLEL